MGCDTRVALAPATHDRTTLFAKDSDRPPRECQRMERTVDAYLAETERFARELGG